MDISKTTAIAGALLGTGGAAIAGTAVYVTTTEKTTQALKSPEEVSENHTETSPAEDETTLRADEKVDTPQEKTSLSTIKSNISSWASENGECKIRVKLTDENTFTEIEKFKKEDKKDYLNDLLSLLNDSNKNSEAKEKCGKVKNRKMEVTQKSDNSGWTFEIKTLDDVKSKVTNWTKSNGECKVKIKWKNEEKELDEIKDDSKIVDIERLYKTLNNSRDGNNEAKQNCEANKFLVAKKETGTGSSDKPWTFSKEN